MSELVPDTWRYNEEDPRCYHERRRSQRRGPVTDILLWIECYSSLVGVLSLKFPDKTPQFMSYQQTIVKAHRSYIGEGWVTYDTCYHRKAAMTKSLEWGHVDFSLYNETFTGRAKAISRCRYCLSEHHGSGDCTYAPAPRPTMDIAPRPASMGRRQPLSGPSSPPLCQLFNAKYGDKCRFNPCKFTHACADCGLKGHPISSCRDKQAPTGRMARPRSPRYRPKK